MIAQKLQVGEIVTIVARVRPTSLMSRKEINSKILRFFVVSYSKEERSYLVLTLSQYPALNTSLECFTQTLRDKSILSVTSSSKPPSDMSKWEAKDAYYLLQYEVLLVDHGMTRAKRQSVEAHTFCLFCEAVGRLRSSPSALNLKKSLDARKNYFIARRTPLHAKKLSRSCTRRLKSKQNMRNKRKGLGYKSETVYVTPNNLLRSYHRLTDVSFKIADNGKKPKGLQHKNYTMKKLKYTKNTSKKDEEYFEF